MSHPRTSTRRVAVVAAVLAALVAVTGCSSGSPKSSASSSSSPTPAPTTSATTAPPPPVAPTVGTCHRLSVVSATHPTDATPAVPCTKRHTAVTYFVGRFNPVVDGHLLAVDSNAVQAQLADRCPRRLPAYLGGSPEDRRLARFRAVWFGPTVAEGDAGAQWFRCDVVAVGSPGRLARLDGTVEHVLDQSGALDHYGTCASTAPATKGFRHLICSHRHSWQAIATVDLHGVRFHGKGAQSSAENTCNDQGANRANGALKYSTGFEWPSRAQWDAGQRYGFCWFSG
jgi:hypothetical protein